MIVIYTDGSTLKNGSKDASGGFGVVVTENDKIIDVHYKTSIGTTNNREEMKAIIWALSKYGYKNPIVYSDSGYAVNTFNTWMWNWKRNNWIKSDKKVPENLDLIQIYDELISMNRQIDLRKIKGHAGHEYNELADQLATGKITPMEVLNKYV